MSSDNIILASNEVDFTELVGREIKFKTEQYSGRILTTRVVSVRDDSLIIDRSGSSGLVNQLIPNQKIEVDFVYKGQPVVFVSKIIVPREGRMQIPIASEVIPRLQREFMRLDLDKQVKLAIFDEIHISAARLNRLKWLETRMLNLSGGGMLVAIPGRIENDCYFIIHFKLENFELPNLVIARARHVRSGEGNYSDVGVEFIVREERRDKLPRSIIQNIPDVMFGLDKLKRDDLSEFLLKIHKNIK